MSEKISFPDFSFQFYTDNGSPVEFSLSEREFDQLSDKQRMLCAVGDMSRDEYSSFREYLSKLQGYVSYYSENMADQVPQLIQDLVESKCITPRNNHFIPTDQSLPIIFENNHKKPTSQNLEPDSQDASLKAEPLTLGGISLIKITSDQYEHVILKGHIKGGMISAPEYILTSDYEFRHFDPASDIKERIFIIKCKDETSPGVTYLLSQLYDSRNDAYQPIPPHATSLGDDA